MTIQSIMDTLQSLSNESRRKQYMKRGAPENTYGVALGDIRKLAKQVKTTDEENRALWDSGNTDAQFLATMLLKPVALTIEDIQTMVRSAVSIETLDKLVHNVVSKHKESDSLIEDWTNSEDDAIGRSGWNLIVNKVSAKAYSDEELEALLSTIKDRLQNAAPETQWAMNHSLCEIGIENPDFTDRCLAMGEELGVYKEMKVSKGCTSAYAPEWIHAVIKKRK